MAKSGRRPVAVFNFRKSLGIGEFMGRVNGVIHDMGQHPLWYADAFPPLSVVTGHVDELKKAEAKANTRVQGAVASRNVKYSRVVADVHGLLNYVQTLADNTPDKMQAAILILSAGFKLKGRSARAKPPLEARRGRLSGVIRLIARGAGKRDFHEWAMSANKIHWTQLPSTVRANTEVTGLAPLTTLYFRHRVITKDGPQDWSNLVSIVVL